MKEIKKETISAAVICILFGLILCIFNISILKTITRIIGILSIIASLFFLYNYFGKRMTSTITSLVLSIILLILGLYMCINPTQFISTLPMLTGVILIINALAHFQKVLLLKDNGFDKWKVNFAGALFILIIGVLLLMKPIQSLNFIFQLVGAFLILNGILILIDQYYLDKTNS